jgi:hypothetical protein
MRKVMVAMAMLGLLAVSPAAMAQDGGADKPTKFYNFDDMLIDGQFKKPDISKTSGREQAKFKRLSNLKMNFLPKVVESADEKALQ